MKLALVGNVRDSGDLSSGADDFRNPDNSAEECHWNGVHEDFLPETS
jgi:hypothetical protein